jgi:hypothetical protein
MSSVMLVTLLGGVAALAECAVRMLIGSPEDFLDQISA